MHRGELASSLPLSFVVQIHKTCQGTAHGDSKAALVHVLLLVLLLLLLGMVVMVVRDGVKKDNDSNDEEADQKKDENM